MARLISADTRPLVSDPINTGYNMIGWELVDKIIRSESGPGFDALAAVLDALLSYDLEAAYGALIDVRAAAVAS